MDTFLGLTATAWTAVYALLTAGLLGVAIAAAVYARKQWLTTLAQRDDARQAQEDARRAQHEASRPYVLVTIEASPINRAVFNLCIRNIGVRPAMDVSVALDPPPERVHEADGARLADVKMLNEPIKMIAPGQTLQTFYDTRMARKGVSGLPTEHAVSLNYYDSSGHKYQDTSVLDLDPMRGSLDSDVKTTHHVAKQLEGIKKLLDSSSVLDRRGHVTTLSADEAPGAVRVHEWLRSGQLRTTAVARFNDAIWEVHGPDSEVSGTAQRYRIPGIASDDTLGRAALAVLARLDGSSTSLKQTLEGHTDEVLVLVERSGDTLTIHSTPASAPHSPWVLPASASARELGQAIRNAGRVPSSARNPSPEG